MNFFMVGASIWALLLWVHLTRYLPQKRAITGCLHTRGRTVPTVPDNAGRMTAITWLCRDCPFQVSIAVHRVGFTTDERPAFAVIPQEKK